MYIPVTFVNILTTSYLLSFRPNCLSVLSMLSVVQYLVCESPLAGLLCSLVHVSPPTDQHVCLVCVFQEGQVAVLAGTGMDANRVAYVKTVKPHDPNAYDPNHGYDPKYDPNRGYDPNNSYDPNQDPSRVRSVITSLTNKECSNHILHTLIFQINYI